MVDALLALPKVVDGPPVLVSPEWAKAVEAGRWPSEVRPFTRNRSHVLYKAR